MKKQGVKVTVVRILLIASLATITGVALIRGRDNHRSPTSPSNQCENCAHAPNCDKK